MAEEGDRECIPNDLEHKVDRLLSPFQCFIEDQTAAAPFLLLRTVAGVAGCLWLRFRAAPRTGASPP